MSNRLSRIAGFTVLTGVTVVSQSGIAHAADLTETTTDSNAVAGTPGDHIETLAKKYDTSTLVKSVVKTSAGTTAASETTVTAATYKHEDKKDDWKKTDDKKVEEQKEVKEEAECPTDIHQKLDNISFTINGVSGFTTLEGNVNPGDEVKAEFEVIEGCEDVELSLAAYDAPSGTFVEEEAEKQVLKDSATGKFDAGKHSLEITAPDCFYQVDFVHGKVLKKLGPAGSDNFYGDRLIDFENGGQECVVLPPPETPEVPETPVEAPPVVESVQLAKTGTDTVNYAALGSAMLMMGFAMDRTSRRMRKNRQARIARNDQLLASAFGLSN